MELIAAIILVIPVLPVTIICFQKYMRMYDRVWKMNESSRGDAIDELKGYALPMAFGLSIGYFCLVLMAIWIIEWLQ